MHNQTLIAITGANGFIGSFLVRSLESDGSRVRRLVRNGGVDGRCHAVGDLAAEPEWLESLRGVDTVVHCAAFAEKPEGPLATERLFRVNRDAVAALAKACQDVGVRRLIFLSSVKVYGEVSSDQGGFSEADTLSPDDDYGMSKAEAEQLLLAGGCAKNLDVCVLRLPLVYGPGVKGNFARLMRLAYRGMPLPLASVDNRRSLLGLDNLAAVVAALVLDERKLNDVFNVADPTTMSTPELLRSLGSARHCTPRLFRFPVPLLRVAARMVGVSASFAKLTESAVVNTTKLAAALPNLRLAPTDELIRRYFSDCSAANGVQ